MLFCYIKLNYMFVNVFLWLGVRVFVQVWVIQHVSLFQASIPTLVALWQVFCPDIHAHQAPAAAYWKHSPYKCPYCDKSFTLSSRSGFYITHPCWGEASYLPLCSKTFISSAHLALHLHSHTGEREVQMQCMFQNVHAVVPTYAPQDHPPVRNPSNA